MSECTAIISVQNEQVLITLSYN